MARNKRPIVQGAPEWVLTYGDLMSLLLCFFILLAAFANFDRPNPPLETALDSIRRALGLVGNEGPLVDPAFEFAVLVETLQATVRKQQRETGNQPDRRSLRGVDVTIRRIRDGAEITMGGSVTFDRFSAALKPEGREIVLELGGRLAGHLNIIEVRGHATSEHLPDDSPYKDPMDLSIARSRAVVAALMEAGVDPRVLRVVGVGCSENVRNEAFPQEQDNANRRVEILVRESVVADYDAPRPPADVHSRAADPPAGR